MMKKNLVAVAVVVAVVKAVLADALRLAQAIVMAAAPTTVTVCAVVTAGLIANQSTRVKTSL